MAPPTGPTIDAQDFFAVNQLCNQAAEAWNAGNYATCVRVLEDIQTRYPRLFRMAEVPKGRGESEVRFPLPEWLAEARRRLAQNPPAALTSAEQANIVDAEVVDEPTTQHQEESTMDDTITEGGGVLGALNSCTAIIANTGEYDTASTELLNSLSRTVETLENQVRSKEYDGATITAVVSLHEVVAMCQNTLRVNLDNITATATATATEVEKHTAGVVVNAQVGGFADADEYRTGA